MNSQRADVLRLLINYMTDRVLYLAEEAQEKRQNIQEVRCRPPSQSPVSSAVESAVLDWSPFLPLKDAAG